MTSPSIVWFRQDLRLRDNPALLAAASAGPVAPLFIFSPEDEGAWPAGAASRWWLHHSLQALQSDLARHRSTLTLRRGPALEQLRRVIRETGASQLFFNRRYEPDASLTDQHVIAELQKEGVVVRTFNSHLLIEPWEILNQSGKPFRVFTPYWRHCLDLINPPAPQPIPEKWTSPAQWPTSLTLDELGLEPRRNWASQFPEFWHPGESGAQAQLAQFCRNAVFEYGTNRNIPSCTGTSRLSPHLHWGELSIRDLWHALGRTAAAHQIKPTEWQHWQYIAELGWREFGYHLLHYFPTTPQEPLKPEFSAFPWRHDPESQSAWQRGATGYPIIDAGMRELWQTGWMHNRVRMIAASFLLKDLLQPWQAGARWFWDTLVDADLASNTLGWQWSAGCGADAQPFFRIFNPVLQGEKFDPQGTYVRRWAPELARVPDRWIHQPWKAPESVLRAANVELGKNYPAPIISHEIARNAALEALQKIKRP